MWIDAYLRRRNLSNRAAFSLAKILELILKSCVTYIEFSRYLANCAQCMISKSSVKLSSVDGVLSLFSLKQV